METVLGILWRKLNKASLDSLRDISKGQYDLRLGSKDYNNFFSELEKKNLTSLGGYLYEVPVQKFLTEIPEKTIDIKYMGDKSNRKDWNIPSQRPATCYPLWGVNRRLPKSGDLVNSYIMIIKTIDYKYHARLILENDYENLPERIKDMISGSGPRESGYHIFKQYSSKAEEIYNDLIKKHNLLLFGPPGTGKTTLMQEVVDIFKHGAHKFKIDVSKEKDFLFEDVIDANLDSESIWTTFHQSYSYEDFIIGLTTSNGEDDKLLSLSPKPGVLLELSEYARKKGRRGLLIIDELNRGNVSKIFGEFITLIEPDKRLSPDNTENRKTVKIRLPHIQMNSSTTFVGEFEEYSISNPYTMPYPLYVMASMNSIDQSIFPLDSALRRRFSRYELLPDLDLLSSHLKIDGDIDLPSKFEDFTTTHVKYIMWNMLLYINQRIEIFIGIEYTLGHSYLWSLGQDTPDVSDAVQVSKESIIENIYPQLQEIFRGRPEIISNIFKIERVPNDKVTPFVKFNISLEEEEVGANITYKFSTDSLLKMNDKDFIDWVLYLIDMVGNDSRGSKDE